MSDGHVGMAIMQMEAWLADPTWEADPEALLQWNAEFQAALGRAEKGPGWTGLITRAHAAGRELEVRIAAITAERDQVKAVLEGQALGNRALKGYGASSR